MKQDPPSCSIARLEYFFWMKPNSSKRKQAKIDNLTGQVGDDRHAD